MRITTVSMAGVVLVGVCLGVLNLNTSGPSSSAFADVVKQIQKAKTITWKEIFYEHLSTKDGQSTWSKTHTTECAFKAPGLYRRARLDDEGQVETVEITDTIHGRELSYCPREKKATLSEFTPHPVDRGPFASNLEGLDSPNLQWVGSQMTDTGEVNVFRHAFRWYVGRERDWSCDFWIDAKTKQLVAIRSPGADVYDPDHDPTRGNPAGDASSHTAMGTEWRDIRYDVPLDDSLFRLEPPQGYTREVKPRERVTEKEMVDYLGVVAEFNDKTFPDTANTPWNLLSKIDRASQKPPKDRTEAERKLLETDVRYSWRFGTTTNAPVLAFFFWDSDATVEDSFRYLGKGVKLGDKDRIVCWYKLKDANAANTYRVVYGDLSIKNVAAEDLPLPVEQ